MENDKSILSIRIKELRTRSNMTQEELALKLGLRGKSSIANYESDKITPSDDVKIKMCDLFGCSMDYLMGESDFKTKEEELTDYIIKQNKITILTTLERDYDKIMQCELEDSDIDKIVDLLADGTSTTLKSTKEQVADINEYLSTFNESKRKIVKNLIIESLKEIIYSEKSRQIYHQLISSIENENKISSSYYSIPVYGQISAGLPNWAEECLEGYLPIDPNMMNIINPEECFFLRINGESMNKVIHNGAYALIRKQDIVENGEIAAVLVNGDSATIKKFTQHGDVIVLEPMSDNPNYQTQIYDKNTSIKIVGKYIGKFEINN